MTQTRRTTVTASESSFQTLEAEARRRDVSLSAVLREAVEEKATALRERRRPRVGIARSTDGLSAATLTSEVDALKQLASLGAPTADIGRILGEIEAGRHSGGELV